MKEPVMITCPHCGKETPAEDACQHCGKDIKLLQGLEIQYRDFKGSEMLDIKMASHARQKDERPAQQGMEAENHDPRSEKKRAGNKAVFFWAMVVIILSALAWYYLLNFFLKF